MDTMTLAAASGPTTARLTLAALALLGIYLIAVAVYPYVPHSRCNGTGKLRSPAGTAWRPCNGCQGTGRTLRAGRRIWAAVARHRGKRQ